MLELFMLGVYGTYPGVGRPLASAFVRVEGKGILLDCGEATQIELQKYSVGFSNIDYILITHLHADHVSGLLGMMLAMKQAQRTEPILIVGPAGIKKYVESFLMITSKFGYPVSFLELNSSNSNANLRVGRNKDILIKSIHVQHNRPCFAYSIELKRNPRFNIEKAIADGIPRYNLLDLFYRGKSFNYNGIDYDGSIIPNNLRESIKRGHFMHKKIGEYTIHNNQTIHRHEVSKETWRDLINNYSFEYHGRVYNRADLNVVLLQELSKGNSFTFNSRKYKGEDYIEGPRNGLKLSYVTDTRPIPSIRPFIANSDIAVIEGMYRGNEDEEERMKDKMHMRWEESLGLARNNGVKEVILTHYSPSLKLESSDSKLVKSILPNAVLGVPGLYRNLSYDNVVEKDIKGRQYVLKSGNDVREQEEKVEKVSREEEEPMEIPEILSRIGNKKDVRSQVLAEFVKKLGLKDAIINISRISTFRYDVLLSGGVRQIWNIYRSRASMKETYINAWEIDGYFVFVQQY